jgi:lysozyme family protein
MVGPSITKAERDETNRRLKIGMVLLIGASGGLVSLQADPTPAQVAAAIGVSLVIGAALTWFVVRTLREFAPQR